MPASELLVMPSCLKTIPIKLNRQSGKRTPAWRLVRSFSPLTQLKVSEISRELFAISLAFLEIAQIPWEAAKPATVVTDNKSVARSFQTKPTSTALWNVFNYNFQLSFKIVLIAGSLDILSAADILVRLELKVTVKIRLKIREDFQTTPIQVTMSSSDVADEEQTFFIRADNENELEKQTFDQTEQSRQNAEQGVAN